MIQPNPLNASCASFGMLWLTDFHFGQHAQRWLWPEWEEEFFKDLEYLHGKAGPFDAVLFTGDLVFSGQPAEYDGLSNLFDRLRDLLAKMQPSLPCLLSVPGNHDLRRPDRRLPVPTALRHYWKDDTVRREFWENPNSQYRELITTAFEPYCQWLAKTNFSKPADLQHGILPGDFAATIRSGPASLGIVGLNTSFLQMDGGDYEGQLDLDVQQLHTVCSGNATKWIKERHASILLTHHPYDWLATKAQDHFHGAIYPTQRFIGHFFGHMHQRADRGTAHGGAPARWYHQGCSLFGLENYGEAFDKGRLKFGYAAFRIELDRDTSRVRFWPRKNSLQHSGDYRLVPDTEVSLERGTDYFVRDGLALNLPCERQPTTVHNISHSTYVPRAEPSVSPDVTEQRRAARTAIDQGLKELEEKRPTQQPSEHLQELTTFSVALAHLGDRQKAWAILMSAFNREKKALQSDQRLTIGLQLTQFLLEDKVADMAARVLNELRNDADQLPECDLRKGTYWELVGRCAVSLSAYQEAAEALKLAIALTQESAKKNQLIAELAELHLLRGNIDQALIAAIDGGLTQ